MSSDNSRACTSLSKKELNQSLSSKKKKKKGSLKTVLASPYLSVYNQLKPADEEIKELLKKTLPVARIAPNDTEANEKARENRKNLALGVNGVTRRVDRSKVSSVLVAGDVKPEMMVTHLISKCQANSIPVLKVDDLRDITMEALGFECIAVGFDRTEPFLEIVNSMEKSMKEASLVLHSKKEPILSPSKNRDKLKEIELVVSNLSNQDSVSDKSVPVGISPNRKRKREKSKDNGSKKQKVAKLSTFVPAEVVHVPSNPNRKNKKKKK